MGTNCDEKCSCSNCCENTTAIDRNNGKPWRSRIALRLKPPDVLSSRFHHYNAFVAQGAKMHASDQNELCSAIMPPCEKFSRSFAPIETTIWISGSSQGAALASHTWMRPIAVDSLFIIVFQTCFYAICSEFLLLFLGISILSVFPCHGGLQPPFTTPLHISCALA